MKRPNTFVGTPLYVSPEMLESNEAGRFTDFWALGVIIYEMAYGTTPFFARNDSKVFDNILNRRLDFPKNHSDPEYDVLDDLIDKLL